MKADTQTIDILLLGSGGREHALAAKLAASPRAGKLYIAPGNGGTASCGENVVLDDCDPAAVAAFAQSHGCGLVVIGPEAPLVAGVADAVREALGSADSRERIARMLADAEEERADEKPLSETIKGELAKIETAFSNIWAAIESGIAPPGGKERIDALKQRQALLKDELRTAEALEAARLDYDRALFWLEGMAAAEVDDAQLLRTFVARVVLGGPDDDDGLRVAFTFDDSAGLGDNPSLPGAIGPGGEVFDRMNASSTNSYRQVEKCLYLLFYYL